MSISGLFRECAILTNNPAVVSMYPMESCMISGNVMDVFIAVRNAVHKGARIISHPLSGSIKPNDSPYKSIVITVSTGKLDVKSLNIIEDAISVLSRLTIKNRDYDESVLEDFRIIDLDIIKQIERPVPGDFSLINILKQI